ncbi:MAG TPA: hypothetical protein VGM76_15315 [Lacipirellulaceae bacterium]|jgi:hypothetical protein
MRNRLFLLPAMLMLLAGCGQSAQEKYDEAVDNMTRMQRRLDNLRPAYDAAKQTATMQVCKEITGSTPEESQLGMLKELTGTADEISADQAADVKAEPGVKKKPIGDADAAIDSLMAAEKKMGEKSAAASTSVLKVNDVLNKIKTPGTPENKRFEEVFNALPEVEAYNRQAERVKDAKEDVEDAKKDLPGGEPAESK